MYCKYCGREIDDDSIFCRHCGRQVANAVEAPMEEKLHKASVPHDNVGGEKHNIMLRAPLEFEVARRTKEKPQETGVPHENVGGEIHNIMLRAPFEFEVARRTKEKSQEEPQDGQQEGSLPDDTEIAGLREINPRTKKILIDNGLNTIGKVKDYGLEKLKELPGFGRRGYYDLERLLEDNSHELPDEMDANTREYIQLKYKEYVYGDANINVMKEKNGKLIVYRTKPLLIRAKNLCKYWDSFEDMVKAITSDNPKLPKSFHDIGGVTMIEMKNFYKYTFKPFIKEALALNEREVREGILRYKFPFLWDNQREFVIDFENEHDHTPIFYLLYRYVCQGGIGRSNRFRYDICHRYNRIINLVVGFDREGVPIKALTDPENSKKIRLPMETFMDLEATKRKDISSSERVRQIVANGIAFDPFFVNESDDKESAEKIRKEYEDEYPQRKWFVELVEKNVRHYVNVFRQRELTSKSEAYRKIVEEEHLRDNFAAFEKTMEAIKKLAEGTSAALLLTPIEL